MHPNEIIGGPYLAVAVFSEKVLRETDNVLSLIRIVDRWTIAGPTETMPESVIQTNLVVTMKSGMFRGPSQIVITPTTPSGVQMQAMRVPANFEGDDDRGVAVHFPLAFPVREPGIYWFDISVNGQAQTKVPMRVIYQSVGVQMPIPGMNPG